MMTEQENEKRHKYKLFIILPASLIIIFLVLYFILNEFSGNPIEGTWKNKEADMTLQIMEEGKAKLVWKDLYDDPLKLNLMYVINKKEKQISFSVEPDDMTKAVDALEGEADAAEVRTSLKSILTSHHYSTEGDRLVMQEFDYGEKLEFTKVKK